jgi:hypothetical protein
VRWDIDKALVSLGGDPNIQQAHLSVAGETKKVWCIKFTKALLFHGRSIHEAYLNARRELKKLDDETLTVAGITRPKKRSNSYATARRKKARK